MAASVGAFMAAEDGDHLAQPQDSNLGGVTAATGTTPPVQMMVGEVAQERAMDSAAQQAIQRNLYDHAETLQRTH